MASKRFDPLKIRGLQRVVVAGSFAPNGTSAPTSVKGKGFAVTRSTVGHYVITFEDKYTDFVDIQATVRRPKTAPTFVQAGAYNASARTLDLYVYSLAATAGVGSSPLNIVSGRILDGALTGFNFRNTANQGGILTADSSGAQIFTGDSVDTRLRILQASTARVLMSTALPLAAGNSGIGLQISARQINNTAPGALENAQISVFYAFDDNEAGSVSTPVLSVGSYQQYNLTLSTQPLRAGAQASVVVSGQNNSGNAIDIQSILFTYPGVSIVPADISAAADTTVNFTAMFRNTGVNF